MKTIRYCLRLRLLGRYREASPLVTCDGSDAFAEAVVRHASALLRQRRDAPFE